MFMRFFDYLLYLLVRFVFVVIQILPHSVQRPILSLILDLFLLIRPDYVNVAKINMSMVFPKKSAEDIELLFKRHKHQLVGHFIDLLNWHKHTQESLIANTEYHGLDKFRELRYSDPKRGCLIVSGHISSFELIPDLLITESGQMHYLVRKFKNPYIDRWWNSKRSFRGNVTMDRRDSFRKVLNVLKQGKMIGILFDQNVVRKSAVFTNWFGHSAATTKGPAVAILKTNPFTFVVGLNKNSQGKFVLDLHYCDFSEIQEDLNKESEEKIQLITQRLVGEFEKCILNNPEDWFWMHRRWKTTSDVSIPENFYDRQVVV
jgi:KDO2-lipid IV(A) lauroyltransferase